MSASSQHVGRATPDTAAPTGRNEPAQGKERSDAALGHASQNTSSPEGATESGKLSTGWKSAPLGELCERITKGSSPNWQGFDYCDSGIIFVRSQNVGWGDLKLGEVAHLPAAFNEKEKKSVLKTDDVLLNLVGASIGRACVATSEVDGGNVNQAVAVIRVRPEVLAPKFLVHFLISPLAQARIHSEKVDVARANFSLEDTRSLSIPLPPLPEQRRIVAEIEKQFTRLEAGVAALRRVQANLKRYRAAVLKAACEGRLVPTEAALARSPRSTKNGPPAYETGEALLARILTERRQNWQGRGKLKEPAALDTAKLFDLPAGWTWTTLDALAEIKGGITKDQNRKHTAPARSVPYLRVANVQRGYIDLTEVKEIVTTEDEIWELALKPGDILFNEGGDRDKLGRGWVWNGELPECIHQNHVFRARLYVAALNPKLVSWYANTFGQKFFFDEGKHTTNLASISMSKLKGLPVPIPPPAEQTRIVAEVERRLSVVQELESVVTANLQRATRLRQSILQKAFSGGFTCK
jgi:type I restriction enzyme S subunit